MSHIPSLSLFEKIVQKRRAVRVFDSDYRLEEGLLECLLENARYAPTAFNLQHERFLVVRSPLLRQEIEKAAWNQKQITQASALIILCADCDAWKNAAAYAQAPSDVRDLYVNTIIPSYYKDQPERQRDEAIRSASMAAYGLMLAATAAGLATCPIGGFDTEKVSALINLPENHLITMMIVLGKEAELPASRTGQLTLEQMVRTDHF